MNQSDPIQVYLGSLQEKSAAGEPDPAAHRAALAALIQTLQPEVTVAVQPDRDVPGLALGHDGMPVGSIATADLGDNLDLAERSEPLRGYLQSSHNLILTNYLEFRWYTAGELRSVVHLGYRTPAGDIRPTRDADLAVAHLLELFLY
jgi:hypothetical protein